MKFNQLKKSLIGLLMISGFIIGSLVVVQAVEPKSSADVSITFWYTENDSEKACMTDLVAEFEATNPDIEVEALQKGFFDARSLYINNFIAGAEPDVFRAARDWVTEFAQSKMIAPVTDYYTEDDLADFLPKALKLVTYPDEDGDDQYWGFPQLLDTPALMYNKELFTDAGIDVANITFETSWTWDEYLNYCTILNASSDEVYATTHAGMFFGAQPIYYGHGARLFEDRIVDIDHIAINTTEAREALVFLYDLINSTVTPRWEEQGWTPLNLLFADYETAAMISQGPWEIKNFLETQTSIFSANNSKLGIMQLPHDEVGNQGAPIGAHSYVVSAFTTVAEKDASIKFAKFLSGQHAMAKGAIEYYHVPARASVISFENVTAADSFPYVNAYYEAVQNAYEVPISHYWASLEQDFANQIDEYLADSINLDQCIQQTIVLWKDTLVGGVNGTSTETSEPEIGIPGYSVGIVLTSISWAVLVIALKRKEKK